jgi:NADPH:quinone reductase-like Zn-dependent oxidoreductase
VIGTGWAADRDRALGLGVDAFLDPLAHKLEDAGEVDVVFDVIGGEILDRSAALVRAGGTLVTTIRVPTVQPKDGRGLLRRRSRPFSAGGPRSATQGRTAQADRRDSPAARRGAGDAKAPHQKVPPDLLLSSGRDRRRSGDLTLFSRARHKLWARP